MNRIEAYTDSVIPKNLAKKKKQLLRDEIEAHIYDRIAYYTDIGYDEETAITKAISDMGDDEETKAAIHSDFEALHFERIWWAILSAIGVLLINSVAFITGNWIVSADSIGAPDEPRMIMLSFAMVFMVILAAILFYKSGMRKCLVGLGTGNLIVLISLLMSYHEYAVYSLVINISYLLDRFTPLVLRDIASYRILYGILAYVETLTLLLSSLIFFVLSLKIKHRGKPRKTNSAGMVIFVALYLSVSVISSVMTNTSAEYFENYPQWFLKDSDSISETSAVVYEKLTDGMTVNEVKETLLWYGYISVDDFEKTLDKNTSEIFRHNFEELEFFFGDEYTVYLNPERLSPKAENDLVFIKTDEDGKLKSKGIGNGFKDMFSYTEIRDDDIPECKKVFEDLSVGNSKTDVLNIFGTQYGEILTCFTTYTEKGENTYYRVYCDGNYFQFEVPLSSEKDSSVVIELEFENEKLTDGKLWYTEYHSDYVEEKYTPLS